MWTILVLLSFLVYTVVYFILKYTVFNYWKNKDVPFIQPNFIFGNIWEVISLRKTWSMFIHDMHNKYTQYRYIGMFNIFQPALLIRDIELIKDILVKDFDSFHNNWFEIDPKVDPLMALAPFVLKGNDWKNTRNFLTPQFTSAKIKSMFPLLQEVCKNMVLYIRDNCENSQTACLELTNLSSRFTGDSVMSCAFGLDVKSFYQPVPETFLVDGVSSSSPTKFLTLKRTFAMLSRTFSKTFKATFYGNPIPGLFSDIIGRAVGDRIQNRIVRNDYLNYLMELRKKHKIAPSDVAGYAYIFFLDGFETTYVIMAYALLELSLNLTIQTAARKEIETVLQKYDGKITFEAHKELNYLECIILETIRKYSVVRVMSKVCTKSYVMQDKISQKSIVIEKGTPLFWSLRALHYDPAYYPDPEKFDPDRFTQEGKQARPKYSFQGFGDGPRVCIGKRFAISELVLALASILLNFDLTFNTKTTFPVVHDSFHVTDVPVSKLYVDFTQRS